MAIDPEITRHKEWLGFLQPVGLVVSPLALVKSQAVVNRNVVDLQQSLLAVVDEDGYIADFPAFTVNVLGWADSDLVRPSPEYPSIKIYFANRILPSSTPVSCVQVTKLIARPGT
ncbi:hypothetical protein NIES4074_63820 (plasmid) [Cylindrospermum sp. NIES-4074]|nr:hypothetical protein NIES4074_61990 [Cylindrospermum sp. NIES-4074]BAZ33868.1 hypothetical protein NIES4074_63820 [Cylindrospermum sp. NIES-4074]